MRIKINGYCPRCLDVKLFLYGGKEDGRQVYNCKGCGMEVSELYLEAVKGMRNGDKLSMLEVLKDGRKK